MHFEDQISFSCIKVIQPIGEFYIGTIGSGDLVAISYADVRTIERERRDVERHLGIERPLSPSRVAELKEYVKTVDASFPTSIILAVESKDAVYDENAKTMTIRRDEKVAKIIDGQHRIDGLKGYVGPAFQLNVTVFVDMDIEDQAMVFATINLKQTRVSKSLAYDLYEFSKTRSPQRTCHDVAKLLNYTKGSPFKDKIKILGVATGKPQESITQAAFVDRLMPYISTNAMIDRDLIKRKKDLDRATGKKTERLIFRNLFIDDADAKIAKNLWNYFGAVEKRWPRAWPVAKLGNILNRTTGFGALMRLLRDVYVSFAKPDQVVSTGDYYSVFERIGLTDDVFTPEKYKPGSSGESDLYGDFLRLSGLQSS